MALVPLNPPAPRSFARRTAWDAPAALKYWHLASLDAPTVAATWACAMGWSMRTHVAGWTVALLALVVWSLYIVDRLLDADSGLKQPGRHILQERHWFHWRHRVLFASLAAGSAVAAAWLIVQRLPAAAVGHDCVVGVATLAYFSGVHGYGRRAPWFGRIRRLAAGVLSRELLVGVIFSAGCVVPLLPMAGNHLSSACMHLAIPAAAFAVLAWLNLRAIGCWESKRGGVAAMAMAVACACLLGGLACASWEPRMALLLVAAAGSALLLGWLDGAREQMEPVTLRACADLVLLVPLLPMAAEWIAR